MTILVTRPAPAGAELVEQLRRVGRRAWHWPLIEFLPGHGLPQLAPQLASLASRDIVISVSIQALAFAGPQLILTNKAWPTTLDYYAIGRNSALHLHQYCQQPVQYPTSATLSEALLELPGLQQLAGRQVLILRGNGGRELLATTLEQRGAMVSYCETYRRAAIPWHGATEAAQWRRLGVSCLVVTSGEMLQRLFDLMPVMDRQEWLLDCRLVVVSQRVATLARQLGWHDIVVADGADNDALLRALH